MLKRLTFHKKCMASIRGMCVECIHQDIALWPGRAGPFVPRVTPCGDGAHRSRRKKVPPPSPLKNLKKNTGVFNLLETLFRKLVRVCI